VDAIKIMKSTTYLPLALFDLVCNIKTAIIT